MKRERNANAEACLTTRVRLSTPASDMFKGKIGEL